MWTLLISLAFADLIAPKPVMNCPDGSTWANSGGRWVCAPASCDSDEDCPDGTCKKVSLCLKTSSWERQVGRPGPDNPPRTFSSTAVTGLCADDGGCDDGSCEARAVCMPGDNKEGSPPSDDAAEGDEDGGDEAEDGAADTTEGDDEDGTADAGEDDPEGAAPPPPKPDSSDGCSHLSTATSAAGAGLLLLALAGRRRD